jgi:sugar phosphate isomerase/epimerase
MQVCSKNKTASSNDSTAPSEGRRRFIAQLTAAGMAVPLLRFQPLFSRFPAQDSAIKINVFSKPLGWLGYDDLAAILSDAGADGIDLTVRPLGHVLPGNAEKDLPLAVEAARKKGLKTEMIVTSILSTKEKDTESILRTASSLGIKYYRMGWYNYDYKLGIENSLTRCIDELKGLEEMNARFGIHGAYQNHAGSYIGGAVWDLYEMIRDFDPNYIGCQYDIRHAVVEGSESWENGLRLIAPWIKCSDIKDFKWIEAKGKAQPVSVPLGEGIVDFDRYFSLLKELDIKCPFSLHFEYPPFEAGEGSLTASEKRTLFFKYMSSDIRKLRTILLRYNS